MFSDFVIDEKKKEKTRNYQKVLIEFPLSLILNA